MGGQAAEKIPKKVTDSVKRGECILFLGGGVHAGPSQGSGFVYVKEKRPLQAGDLATKLARATGFYSQFPKKEFPAEYPLLLQRVSWHADTPKGGGRSNLIDLLLKHLQTDKEPSPALRALAELPFTIVVTTNYDHLLETALSRAGKRPQVILYNPNDKEVTRDFAAPTEKTPAVFKIHGDLSRRESIVITDEDYIRFVQRMTSKEPYHPIPATVRFLLQKWTTVFVGYSLRDYNLRLLYRTLRWGVDEANFPLSYSVDRHPDPLIQQVWENENNFVLFLVEDLWKFVPQLYKEIKKKDMPNYENGK